MGSMLSSFLRGTIRDTQGQSLIEYSLLLGFVGLVAAGLALQSGTSVKDIASTAVSTLTAANSGGGSGTGSAPVDPGGGGGEGDGHRDGGHGRH